MRPVPLSAVDGAEMKGRALVDSLRNPQGLKSDFGCPELCDLLADAVEETDVTSRSLIESECHRFPEGVYFAGQPTSGRAWWFDTDDVEPYAKPHINRALSYLDRRGLIERKAGEPHLVRFVEEA